MALSFVVLGDPVEHSLSPVMHRAAFEHAGLEASFETRLVSPGSLAAAVDELRRDGFAGASVTLPHKRAAFDLAQVPTAAAQAARAVNVLAFQDGRIAGDNTDGSAVIEVLRHEFQVDPAGLEVVIIGAGGNAQAIGAALAGAGVRRLTIANRSPARGAKLASFLAARHPALTCRAVALGDRIGLGAALLSSRIVIQASSAGLAAHETEPVIPLDLIPAEAVVLDSVYRPGGTPFVRAAQRLGLRVTGGLAQLAWQGALAWLLWFGRVGPVQVMRRAAEAALGQPD